jgi:hypothetical protein
MSDHPLHDCGNPSPPGPSGGRRAPVWVEFGIVCAVVGLLTGLLAGAVGRVQEAAARVH